MQGKIINGFELKWSLGRGGMAEVWYAENEIHKAAAIKILNEELSHNEQIVERFRNEAEIMVKLNHQNIRQVYGYGSIDGRPSIIMEYLDGDDLKDRMKRGESFDEEQLKKWWNQLADALNYTHAQGIVHRDIKPGNIFVDNNGNIKLLDFGIAKLRESISSTQTGQRLGTLMYMSPEQVKDSKHIDYHTDLYSLAVTFVHLLTGKQPYDSDSSSDFEISENIVYKPMDLSMLPGTWKSFLSPYLEKEPTRRPPLCHFMMDPYDVGDGTMAESGYESARPVMEVPLAEKQQRETASPSSMSNRQREETSLSSRSEDKPKRKTWLWLVLAALLVGGGIAYFLVDNMKKQEEEKNARMKEENWFNNCTSIADYQDYLDRYPNGEYAAQASRKIELLTEEKYFNDCVSIADYQGYLDRYPNGTYAVQASQQIESLRNAYLEENVRSFIMDFVRLTETSDTESIYSLVQRLYAPSVKRYYSAYDVDRDYVADCYCKYDDMFEVYGKHSNVRWNTVSFTESNGNIMLTYVDDYSIDRYDPSKYSIFVLEKHFELNSDFKVLSVYDVQLSKSKQ